MSSIYQRSRQRRAERAPITNAGNLNLVPLVDVLTAVVFFSLLTYQGAALAALTSYDLSLPPVVITAEQARASTPDKQMLTLLLAVRVEPDKLIIEHSEEGGYRQEIAGLRGSALDSLQSVMTQIRQRYPQNVYVLVVPADEISYDDVIHVLERLRMSNYSGISLGTRSRAAQVAAVER